MATAFGPGRASAEPVVEPSRIVTIAVAEFCRDDAAGDSIPGPDCKWQPVALPHEWNGHSDKPLKDAWFKLKFRLEAVPEDGVALFATTFNRTGRVFVNSTKLLAVASMQAPLPLNWNRGQFMVLPAAMLRVGANEIEIQERVYGFERGTLSRISLGPEPLVRPLWEWRTLWQNDAVEVLGSITGAIGLVMLGVWLLRRTEASYFWFGCTCWVWTVSNLDFYIVQAPLPARMWDLFVLASTVLRAVVMFMFTLRYSGHRKPRLEFAIWAYFAAGAIGLAVRPDDAWLEFWFLGPLIATPYFSYLLGREGLRRNLLEGVLLCIATVTESLLSWYDAWLYSSNTLEPIFLAHYSTPLYVSVVGLSLIRHFVSSLNGYERQYELTLHALDEANKATKDKNLFFSMVSHELKSPLQSIITVLATEDKRAAGRERRESLVKIHRSVKYMEAQIRDLFVLSVGEAGKLEMRSETFEVGELVDEVMASVSSLAAGKGLRISLSRPDDLLFVATDPKRLEQVLLNLVENAVKYTHTGGVSIAYGLENETLLRVEISDTGIGIAREHIDKLFVPYRRFALLDREHNSLGIGLAVVQTLLTHLGGQCAVTSTPGAGSSFTVRIPVAVEKERPSEPPRQDAVWLLIVDDRPDMLADLREVAQTLGYNVDTAASAQVASNLLAVSVYDLVLIDLDMPVKNGYEFASEIRRSSSPNSETCLVAFSAGSPEAQGVSTAVGGWPFDSFEQKPVDARAMKRIVETRARSLSPAQGDRAA